MDSLFSRQRNTAINPILRQNRSLLSQPVVYLGVNRVMQIKAEISCFHFELLSHYKSFVSFIIQKLFLST